MSERDSQSIVLSRQSILLVTAVGVGLLTLCYVLGVQVGKQSAALRATATRGSGEELEELPAPLQDQLKALEDSEMAKPSAPAPAAPAPSAAPAPAAAPSAAPPAAAPAPKPQAEAPAAEDTKWTVQLVSTPDPTEAERVAAKAKAAGFPTSVLRDKNLFKVRLVKTGTRSEMDAQESKLKARGFKTYTIKVG